MGMLNLIVDFTDTFKENSHDTLYIACKSRKHFGSVLISKSDITYFTHLRKILQYFSFIFHTFCSLWIFQV